MDLDGFLNHNSSSTPVSNSAGGAYSPSSPINSASHHQTASNNPSNGLNFNPNNNSPLSAMFPTLTSSAVSPVSPLASNNPNSSNIGAPSAHSGGLNSAPIHPLSNTPSGSYSLTQGYNVPGPKTSGPRASGHSSRGLSSGCGFTGNSNISNQCHPFLPGSPASHSSCYGKLSGNSTNLAGTANALSSSSQETANFHEVATDDVFKVR